MRRNTHFQRDIWQAVVLCDFEGFAVGGGGVNGRFWVYGPGFVVVVGGVGVVVGDDDGIEVQRIMGVFCGGFAAYVAGEAEFGHVFAVALAAVLGHDALLGDDGAGADVPAAIHVVIDKGAECAATRRNSDYSGHNFVCLFVMKSYLQYSGFGGMSSGVFEVGMVW